MVLGGCSAGPSSSTGIGEPAPELTGPTLDGAAFDLAAMKGHPVVVNFWASWCTPCRSEFPVLRDALAANAADGLVLVGVLFKDDPAPAQDFIASFGATWPTLDDPDDSAAAAWRVAAPPQTYFISPDGVVKSIQIGELTADEFARQYAAIAP